MVGTPFLVFYAIGLTLQTDLPYPVKIAILCAGYIGLYFAGRYVFDDRLMNVLPMAVYLATKVSILLKWFKLVFKIIDYPQNSMLKEWSLKNYL